MTPSEFTDPPRGTHASSTLEEATVLLLIGGHLATAPRPQKEARALRDAGARVLIRGTWWNPTLAEEDLELADALGVNYAPVVDLRERRGTLLRARQWLGRELLARTGIPSGRAFGIGAPELLAEARRLRADLTMLHCEAALWAGVRLLDQGLRVGVDFEDWFSRDRPEADPLARALRPLERRLLKEAAVCFAPTRCMAVALAKDAGTSRIPVVIPNCFPAEDIPAAEAGPKDPREPGTVSFHWFSQTIGPGRGLETLAAALPRLQGPWRLALRGVLGAHREWFERTFPAELRGRIQVLEPVPNRELLSRTMSHDVGLALEEPYNPNKDLTASNKLFEYFRAGLAVIATRTQGQMEVMAECTRAGMLVPPENKEALASAMQQFIDQPMRLKTCRHSSGFAGRGRWDWASHGMVLAKSVLGALITSPKAQTEPHDPVPRDFSHRKPR